MHLFSNHFATRSLFYGVDSQERRCARPEGLEVHRCQSRRVTGPALSWRFFDEITRSKARGRHKTLEDAIVPSDTLLSSNEPTPVPCFELQTIGLVPTIATRRAIRINVFFTKQIGFRRRTFRKPCPKRRLRVSFKTTADGRVVVKRLAWQTT